MFPFAYEVLKYFCFLGLLVVKLSIPQALASKFSKLHVLSVLERFVFVHISDLKVLVYIKWL